MMDKSSINQRASVMINPDKEWNKLMRERQYTAFMRKMRVIQCTVWAIVVGAAIAIVVVLAR